MELMLDHRFWPDPALTDEGSWYILRIRPLSTAKRELSGENAPTYDVNLRESTTVLVFVS
jgi:hypothetical protein